MITAEIVSGVVAKFMKSGITVRKTKIDAAAGYAKVWLDGITDKKSPKTAVVKVFDVGPALFGYGNMTLSFDPADFAAEPEPVAAGSSQFDEPNFADADDVWRPE